MSDLLLVNGEARQLVANPHYTILLPLLKFVVCLEQMDFATPENIESRTRFDDKNLSIKTHNPDLITLSKKTGKNKHKKITLGKNSVTHSIEKHMLIFQKSFSSEFQLFRRNKPL